MAVNRLNPNSLVDTLFANMRRIVVANEVQKVKFLIPRNRKMCCYFQLKILNSIFFHLLIDRRNMKLHFVFIFFNTYLKVAPIVCI